MPSVLHTTLPRFHNRPLWRGAAAPSQAWQSLAQGALVPCAVCTDGRLTQRPERRSGLRPGLDLRSTVISDSLGF